MGSHASHDSYKTTTDMHTLNEQAAFYQQTRSCHNNQRMENKSTRSAKMKNEEGSMNANF